MSARVAIVGSGLGGFVAYTTLRHAGLRPDEITVFGRDSDPAGAWRPRAAAIRQRLMRSESDGHCAPTSFPGLAVREAARRRDPAPLVLSVLDRYRPTVEEFLRHVAELRERSRWDESFVPARVDRIAAVDGGFEVGGRGVFRHVLVATGHPGLAVPDELAGRSAGRPRLRAARVRLARRRRRRRHGGGDRMAERTRGRLRGRLGPAPGTGQAAAQRRPAVLQQARPRRLLRRAAGAARRAPPRLRRALVSARPSLGRPRRGGRARGPLPRRPGRRRRRAGDLRHGLPRPASGNDPLLARLVEEHGLESEDRWIVLADDSTVPGLTDATRTLALAGVPGQWAYPAADTLVGMKVAARRFSRRVVSCPTR